ncbi:ABC transporter substrate-binding protein [Phytohabitans sp. ZYX-F-186]|uniref:ABC transporter substrate-binding protein n=1 Tax=Phytohabitans maris TaxID=3071409 RepID=A0ABU0ZMD9_9ACTN|nr:ABC transporter substrate-binding protein [Phytohabitans sp. ZYX-F-186]MDQ7907577.1 ABC transporter substrate-binding protein [Phytohabitans sp. ZYX-F-186]
MAERALRTVTRTQGNNRDLTSGLVRPRRYQLEFVDVPVLVQAFRRMVRRLEFDVCEMAVTTYLCAKEHGIAFTALPIFLVRGFHHGAVVVNTAAGITNPTDLAGRTVGVSRGYTVTTGVWARGVLRDEYGLDLDKVTWAPSGDEHVAEYAPPPNVRPLPAGSPDLAELVSTGALDAAVGSSVDAPGVAPLIPDAAEAGYAALRARGHYPINHLVVVRDELLDAYPDLAADLFEAFTSSKQRYVRRLRDGAVDNPTSVDRTHERVMRITGADPLPYGLEDNRAVLEEIVRHATDQGILTRPVALETLFAEGTQELRG